MWAHTVPMMLHYTMLFGAYEPSAAAPRTDSVGSKHHDMIQEPQMLRVQAPENDQAPKTFDTEAIPKQHLRS